MPLDALVSRRQRALDYKITFGSEHGQRVLQDLYRVCCQQPVTNDGQVALMHEGCRHVWNHIAGKLRLTEKDMVELERQQTEAGDDEESQ